MPLPSRAATAYPCVLVLCNVAAGLALYRAGSLPVAALLWLVGGLVVLGGIATLFASLPRG
jgi:hypothetical protein